MSVAVLRTFISKRKEEHEAQLSKRTKKAMKASEDHDSGLEAPSGTTASNGKSNGESEKMPHGEEPEAKFRGELKPPRVLEVSNLFAFVLHITSSPYFYAFLC